MIKEILHVGQVFIRNGKSDSANVCALILAKLARRQLPLASGVNDFVLNL